MVPLSRAAFLEGSALSVLTALVNTVGKPLLLLYMTRLDPAYGISKEVSFGLAAVLTVVVGRELVAGARDALRRRPCRAARAERHDPARRREVGDAARRRRQGGRRDNAGRQRPDALGRVPQILPNVCDIAVSLVCGVVLLLVFLGWVALVGLGTMALVLTCTVSLSRLAKRYQQRALAAADKTVNALREGVEACAW